MKKTYHIVIVLKDIESKAQAQEVADEIEDKMLPDYDDSIESIKVEPVI
jgi:hypothetical protein